MARTEEVTRGEAAEAGEGGRCFYVVPDWVGNGYFSKIT